MNASHQTCFRRNPSRPGALRLGMAGAALALLAACASDIGPHGGLPDAKAVADKLNLTGAASEYPSITADWWKAFGDPELDRWIALGLADSPDLREAGARVARARAMFETARASQYGSLSADADANREHISDNGFYPYPLAGLTTTLYDIDLSGSIEFDLYGRLSSRTDAARLQTEANGTNAELTRIRLAGAIAHAYFDLAHAQQARRVLVDIEDSRRRMYELVRQRVAAGFDTQVERRQAQIPVPEIRVEIERAGEQVELARHALALLAGQGPLAAKDVQARLPESGRYSAPDELPLDLLARRADIEAAKLHVLSTLRSVDAARADFYPNVNLIGLVGLDSLTRQMVLRSSSGTWSLEPAIHLPLFDRNLLRANLRSASADADSAIASYDAAVLQAAGEVADALASIAAVQRQREQQERATHDAQAASDLADIRYRAGLGSRQPVLSAQAAVLAQRRAQIDLAARRAALDVSLVIALGGGYAPSNAVAAATP